MTRSASKTKRCARTRARQDKAKHTQAKTKKTQDGQGGGQDGKRCTLQSREAKRQTSENTSTKHDRIVLRCLQEAFLEQQAQGAPAAELNTPAADKLYRAVGITKQQAARATSQANTGSNASAAALDTNPSKTKGDAAGRPAHITTEMSEGGIIDESSPARVAADRAPANGRDASLASEVLGPKAAYPVQQGETSRQGEADSTQNMTGALSSRSIDGDEDGMLDRFGSVDIITGRPVRDLKLDPVLQLVKWRESLFGSRDSVSESLDKDDEGPTT